MNHISYPVVDKSSAQSIQPERDIGGADFHPVRIIIPVLLILVLIGSWSQWYAESISIPRYCDDPETTLLILQQVINKPRPAGENARTPYLVAAKLLFLIPRRSNESVHDYLERIRLYMHEKCT